MPRLLALLLLPACIWIPDKGPLFDNDGDGFTELDGDCWDQAGSPPGSTLTGADIYPGAPEIGYDGIDQNCDQRDDYDADGDGWVPLEGMVGRDTHGVPNSGANHLGGGDCWDAPPEMETPEDKRVVGPDIDSDELGAAFVQPLAAETFPGAADTWYDGLDQNCAGDSDFDQDGDGYDAERHRQGSGGVGDDCLDGSWRDEGLNPAGSAAVDVNPAGTEVWYDGTDQDCDTNDCDADEDGAPADPIAGGYCEDIDCDDDDALAVPNSSDEVYYNGQDDNCDNTDGDGDKDGDGHWAVDYPDEVTPDKTVQVPDTLDDCWDDPDTVPAEMVPDNGAEALTADEVYPGAEDRPYDGVPQDCEADANGDGVDDDDDWDRDGYPSEDQGSGDDCVDCPQSAEGTAWYTAYCVDETPNPADLDAGLINPGVSLDTAYDGTDANCDAWNDYDQDQDRYVASAHDAFASDARCGGSACGVGDCDDTRTAYNPGASDTWYSGTDEDCDGRDDYDVDEDGYVSTSNAGKATTYVTGSGSLPGGDCDDSTRTRSPGNTEVCDASNQDEDCDTLADDNDPSASAATKTTFYPDADGDGAGSTTGAAYCDQPGNHVPTNDDCDDAYYSVMDGTAGSTDADFDGVDDDCDGMLDEEGVVVGDLMINEWMINPAGTGAQWFELRNDSGHQLYLDGWRLYLRETIGGAGVVTAADVYISVDAGLSFADSEYLLFCEANTSAWANSTCDYFYGVGDTSFVDFETPYNTSVTNPVEDSSLVFDVLTTSGDQNIFTIGFYEDTGTYVTVDTITYDSTFPQTTSGYAMEATASATAANNNNAGKWQAADATSTFTDGGTQRGTPGCVNTSTTCP